MLDYILSMLNLGELALIDTALYHEILLMARLTPKMCMPVKTNQTANEHCTSDMNVL